MACTSLIKWLLADDNDDYMYQQGRLTDASMVDVKPPVGVDLTISVL